MGSISGSIVSSFALIAQAQESHSESWLEFAERNGFTFTFAVAMLLVLLWVLKKAGELHLSQLTEQKERLAGVEAKYDEVNNGQRQQLNATLESAARHMEDSAQARKESNNVLGELTETIRKMRPCAMSADDLEKYAAIINARKNRDSGL